MTFAEADERPFETIMSGPVAGAEGAGELARRLGPRRRHHRRRRRHELRHVPGHRRPTAAHVRRARSRACRCRRRGSTSARSAPAAARSRTSTSAACSGSALRAPAPSRGRRATGAAATQPTVTDAAFVLGMLGEGRLASGIGLDVEKARAALAPLAQRLDFTEEEVARGHHDDRRRQHGERDPRDHGRAGPGSARRRR